jgi:hypothetical protein
MEARPPKDGRRCLRVLIYGTAHTPRVQRRARELPVNFDWANEGQTALCPARSLQCQTV